MTRRPAGDRPDVIVVGGGVMGAAAAWRLAARGAVVTLLDRYEPGHDRGASHGSSRIFRLAYPHADYVQLAVRALRLWRALEVETGTSVLTLTAAVDHGSDDAVGALHAALTDAGQPAELLTAARAGDRWPWLRFDGTVLVHDRAGRVHADRAVHAFHRAARNRGVTVRTGEQVVGLDVTGSGVEVRLAGGSRLSAGSVVVAAGAWTTSLLDGAVDGLPALTVTQEQPVHFPAAVAPDDWPSFIHHGDAGLPGVEAVYGLGSVHGVKVGAHAAWAVVDPDRRDRSIDPDALRLVQDYAARWLPGVDSARPQPATCLYTRSPTADFVVDRRGPVTVLAGFSGHGFKFAPAIGELAAGLVLDAAPALPRFALGRDALVPSAHALEGDPA